MQIVSYNTFLTSIHKFDQSRLADLFMDMHLALTSSGTLFRSVFEVPDAYRCFHPIGPNEVSCGGLSVLKDLAAPVGVDKGKKPAREGGPISRIDTPLPRNCIFNSGAHFNNKLTEAGAPGNLWILLRANEMWFLAQFATFYAISLIGGLFVCASLRMTKLQLTTLGNMQQDDFDPKRQPEIQRERKAA